jgi:hypothetical protein
MLRDVLQVEEEARRVRAGAGKLSGARGGSGGGGATWRSRERASAAWGAAGAVLEQHVAQKRAARGSWSSGNRPARAAGSAQRETEGEGS